MGGNLGTDSCSPIVTVPGTLVQARLDQGRRTHNGDRPLARAYNHKSDLYLAAMPMEVVTASTYGERMGDGDGDC